MTTEVSTGLLGTPPAPQLTVIGAPGNQQITYFVVATNAVGQDSPPSPAATIGNAPNVLNGANFVVIQIAPVPGALSYAVLKGTTGQFLTRTGVNSQGQIVAVDQGAGTSAYIPATFSPAHWLLALPIGSDHYIQGGPGASGAAVTVTITGVLGFTTNITKLKIYRFAAALLAAAALPVQVTTSNMGGLIIPIDASAAAQGTQLVEDWSPGLSAARGVAQFTNTVITCPATTSVIWTVNGCFYFAS